MSTPAEGDALALWTGVVLLITGSRRIRAVVAGQLPRRAFELGESADVPLRIALANRNLMNLLEMPVLFYVGCLCMYVTRVLEPGLIALAWAFVAARLVHSIIHLTTNRIVHRLVAFALSNLVLLAIWLWFVARLLAAST